MTTPLPTSFADAVETSALAFCRDWIEQQRAPGGAFHPDAEQTYGRSAMKAFAASHVFALDEVVYLADRGSATAQGVLRELIAERMERLEEPGAILRAAAIRLLNPATRKPGPGKTDNFLRDLAIALLVAELRDQLQAQAKPRIRHPSARSGRHRRAASRPRPWSRLDRGVGHPKAVEQIWTRYLPVFAGTRFAEGSRFAWVGLPVPPACSASPADCPHSSSANFGDQTHADMGLIAVRINSGTRPMPRCPKRLLISPPARLRVTSPGLAPLAMVWAFAGTTTTSQHYRISKQRRGRYVVRHHGRYLATTDDWLRAIIIAQNHEVSRRAGGSQHDKSVLSST